MLCKDIIRKLEVLSPKEYALDWDNVGLLVGRRDKDVKKIMIVVDITECICDAAVGQKVDLIISHHPLIFGKLNRINDETPLGRKLLKLIESGICCYAMHTNFDTKGGMAKEAAKLLSLKNKEVLEETLYGEGIGQIGVLDKPVTLGDMADRVRQCFALEHVIIYGDLNAKIEKVAVSPGSGKSVINEAYKKGADCLITGDIGHHEGLDALELGVSIIDASHYGLEKIFMQYIYNYLKDLLTDVELGIADVGVPFTVL